MSRRRPVENDSAMDRPDRFNDRLAAARLLDLPGLAYECESLLVRDLSLPQPLVRDLLVTIALREEADRRRRGCSGGKEVHGRPALTL